MKKPQSTLEVSFMEARVTEFGGVGQPDCLGMRVADALHQVTIVLPTLQAPEIAFRLLHTAQEQARELPPEQKASSLERYVLQQPCPPVEVTGARLSEHKDILEFSIGFGIVRFSLNAAVREELRKGFQSPSEESGAPLK